jgi:hypothetical protein
MNVSQRWKAGLIMLAVLVVSGVLAHPMAAGRSNPDLSALVALAIAGLPSCALALGALSLR